MTLILSWLTTTNPAVSQAAPRAQGSTVPKATSYIRAGSLAWGRGTPCRSASTASNEPNSSLGMPSTIQPGPAASSDRVVVQRGLRAASGAGKKRSTSTCSPICGIRARITEAAPPKPSRSRPRPETAPGKAVQACTAGQSCAAMKPMGSTFSPTQRGCVHSWKRLIQVMP